LSTPVMRVTGGDSSWSASAGVLTAASTRVRTNLREYVHVRARIGAPRQHEICHGHPHRLRTQLSDFPENSRALRPGITPFRSKTKGTNLTTAQHECGTARDTRRAVLRSMLAGMRRRHARFPARAHDHDVHVIVSFHRSNDAENDRKSDGSCVVARPCEHAPARRRHARRKAREVEPRSHSPDTRHGTRLALAPPR
jgi:hypothetical protein